MINRPPCPNKLAEERARVFSLAVKLPPINLWNVNQVWALMSYGKVYKVQGVYKQ
jgi:hypothetical protein